jgi:hypothetical protein
MNNSNITLLPRLSFFGKGTNSDKLICIKKSDLSSYLFLVVLASILIIYIYHKYQKSKCKEFCIYNENFDDIKKRKE